MRRFLPRVLTVEQANRFVGRGQACPSPRVSYLASLAGPAPRSPSLNAAAECHLHLPACVGGLGSRSPNCDLPPSPRRVYALLSSAKTELTPRTRLAQNRKNNPKAVSAPIHV